MPQGSFGVPPMGSAPMGPPSGNPGQQADALSAVRTALDMLEQALPKLEVKSEPYEAVYRVIGQLNKVIPPTNAVPGVQQSQLRDLQQQQQKSAAMQAVMRSMGQGGGPGGQPGGGSPGGAAAPQGAPVAPAPA